MDFSFLLKILVPNLCLKYFWSYAKRKSRLPNNVGPLEEELGDYTNDLKEMKEILS